MTIWLASGSPTERALMVAALEEEGFDACGFETLAELKNDLMRGDSPDLLVLDSGALEISGGSWDDLKRIAPTTRSVLIVGSTSEALPADHILRRPISIGDFLNYMKRIIGGDL